MDQACCTKAKGFTLTLAQCADVVQAAPPPKLASPPPPVAQPAAQSLSSSVPDKAMSIDELKALAEGERTLWLTVCARCG